MNIFIPVSIAEAYDKLTILMIKEVKIKDKKKLENIIKEKEYLQDALRGNRIDDEDIDDLLNINFKLWETEDRKRDLELDNNFGEEFMEIAKRNFQDNDKRAEIKKRINEKYESSIVEEKSYDKFK